MPPTFKHLAVFAIVCNLLWFLLRERSGFSLLNLVSQSSKRGNHLHSYSPQLDYQTLASMSIENEMSWSLLKEGNDSLVLMLILSCSGQVSEWRKIARTLCLCMAWFFCGYTKGVGIVIRFKKSVGNSRHWLLKLGLLCQSMLVKTGYKGHFSTTIPGWRRETRWCALRTNQGGQPGNNTIKGPIVSLLSIIASARRV